MYDSDTVAAAVEGDNRTSPADNTDIPVATDRRVEVRRMLEAAAEEQKPVVLDVSPPRLSIHPTAFAPLLSPQTPSPSPTWLYLLPELSPFRPRQTNMSEEEEPKPRRFR